MNLSKEDDRLRKRIERGSPVQPNPNDHRSSRQLMNKPQILMRLAQLARVNDNRANPVEAMKEISKIEGFYAPLQLNKKIELKISYGTKELPAPIEGVLLPIESTTDPLIEEGDTIPPEGDSDASQ